MSLNNGASSSDYGAFIVKLDPSSVPGTVSAKPGDTPVLWGTGFGATTPSAPAGSAVVGAPSAVVTPSVTVGGIPVPVIGASLTAGSAGLYQVAIQLPGSLPAGALLVEAS